LYGDLDFDDSTAIFTNVQISPVPEPETYAMMLVGLLMITASMGKQNDKKI